MIDLQYTFQDPPVVRFNGTEYPLKVNEADVFEHAVVLRERYKSVDASKDMTEITAAVRACAAEIDSLLGKGALKKMSGGKPVRMADVIEVTGMILDAVAAEYAKKLREYE